MKIVTKLVIGTGVLFLAAASVQGTLRVQRELDLFAQDLSGDLHGLARAVAAALEEEWRVAGEARALALLRRIQTEEPALALRWRPVGARRSAAPLDEGANPAPATGALDALPPVEVSVPVVVDGVVVGALGVSGAPDDEHAYVRQTIRESVAWTVSLIVAMALLTWLVGAALIGVPAKRLMRAAKRLAEGDLQTPLTVDRHDELGAIGGALEEMRVRVLTENERTLEAAAARARAEGLVAEERGKRRQLALQLRHADRLTTVGLLAASVVHDVAAPLSVIAMRAYRLEREATDDVAREASLIRQQADRAGAITRRLLDYSRVEKPGATLDADVREAVHRTLELIGPLAERHGVAVTVDLAPGEPRAAIELGALAQILTNLCTNAVHATPPGGTLSLALRDAGERVVVEVADTGSGMSDDVKRALFTPFFTTKPPGQGTGLGLPVVADLLREVGGRLRVESEVGQGSRFFVEVPLAAPLAREPPPAPDGGDALSSSS